MVQVGAEAARGNCGRQIDIGGGEDRGGDGSLAHCPQPPHGTRLHHLEELRLHLEGKLADLVEEDGPAARRLEERRLGVLGVGECAALVAEELCLGQRGGDPGRLFAEAGGVDGARHQPLADAGLSSDEDGRPLRAGAAQQCDLAPQLAHRVALTQNRRSILPAGAGAAQPGQLEPGPALAQRARDDPLQLQQVERLFQIFVAAAPHRQHRALHRGVGGHGDPHDPRVELGDLGEELQAPHSGKLQIADDHVGRRSASGRERRLGGSEGLDLLAAFREEPGDGAGQHRLVLDDEDHSASAAGSKTRAVVPAPRSKRSAPP